MNDFPNVGGFPLVSIILPVYNGMPFVSASIQSVLDQTWPSWELIVVNDGSTDGSAQYARAVGQFNGQVNYVEHITNRGIAAAYNTGIAHCRGRYVAFQEQDDISVPRRIQLEMQAIQMSNAALVSSQVGWIDSNQQVYHYWPEDLDCDDSWEPSDARYDELLINQTRIANTTTLLDRNRIAPGDLLLDEQFKRSGQDWDFHLRIVRKYPVLRLKESLVLMRRYLGHLSATTLKSTVFQDNRRLLRKHAWAELRTTNRLHKLPVFLKAWSNEFAIEARYYRNVYGILLGCLSLLCWPRNPQTWTSLGNIVKRFSMRCK